MSWWRDGANPVRSARIRLCIMMAAAYLAVFLLFSVLVMRTSSTLSAYPQSISVGERLSFLKLGVLGPVWHGLTPSLVLSSLIGLGLVFPRQILAFCAAVFGAALWPFYGILTWSLWVT